MSYRKIGDLIQLVDVRNKDLSITPLVGLTINKKFIPSVANTIGSDMSKYKIIRKNQFACSTMQVRRDKKMPVALLKDFKIAIISQAYPVFEVLDENEILPEYLMLWFTRSEFDREACFHAVGGVRGSLEWEDFCNMELPIPSIEKQQKIVAQYQAVENKIKVNEQICEKLEAAAQTLYRQWFVDFEFPVSDIEALEVPDGLASTSLSHQSKESVAERSRGYKSSGGKMVFNEELEKEIPEGWEVMSFTETVKLTGGGTPRTDVHEYWNGNIPFFTPADIQKSYYSIDTIKSITKLGLKESSTKLYPKDTVFITARGTVGAIGLSSRNMAMNQSCYAINNNLPYYIHQKTLDVIEKLKGEAVGAVFSALVTKDFDQQIVLEPTESIKEDFNNAIKYIYDLLLSKSKENKKLTQLQSLLLSRLARLEG